MSFFQKKPPISPQLDLQPRQAKGAASVINLRPPFLKRYRAPLSFAVVGVVVASLLFTQLYSQASAAYFYPSSCLGTWKNVDGAQGKAEAEDAVGIDPRTAALFDERSHDIYCGGFKGEVPEGAAIKTIRLNLTWRASKILLDGAPLKIDAEHTSIGGENGEQGGGTTDAGAPPSADAVPNSVIDVPAATPVEFQIEQINPDGTPVGETVQPVAPTEPAATPEPTPTPAGDSSESTPTSWLGVTRVYAQEQSADTSAAVETSVATDAPSASEPPAASVSESIQTSTQTTEEQAAISPVDESVRQINPDGTEVTTTLEQHTAMVEEAGNSFLAVQYTLDGNEWKLLKNVTLSNMYETIDLPLTQWDEITKLQIKIERKQTIDTPPYVYLDGMAVAAEYDDGLAEHTPDFTQDQPLRTRSNDRYVVVETLQHSDGKHVLWLAERGEHLQWRVLADEEAFAPEGPIALKDSQVFWLSHDKRAIAGYRIDASTYFGQTLDTVSSNSSITLEDGSKRIALGDGAFVFTNIATGMQDTGDDDVLFSEGFWTMAAMGVTTSTVPTITTSTVNNVTTTTSTILITPEAPSTTTPEEVVSEEGAVTP